MALVWKGMLDWAAPLPALILLDVVFALQSQRHGSLVAQGWLSLGRALGASWVLGDCFSQPPVFVVALMALVYISTADARLQPIALPLMALVSWGLAGHCTDKPLLTLVLVALCFASTVLVKTQPVLVRVLVLPLMGIAGSWLELQQWTFALVFLCCLGAVLAPAQPILLPVVVLPVLEEAFFRGALLQLNCALGWRVALSSVWFVANHGLEGAPGRLLRTGLYCLAAICLGLPAAMAAHVAVNIFIRLLASSPRDPGLYPHVPQRHVVCM